MQKFNNVEQAKESNRLNLMHSSDSLIKSEKNYAEVNGVK